MFSLGRSLIGSISAVLSSDAMDSEKHTRQFNRFPCGGYIPHDSWSLEHCASQFSPRASCSYVAAESWCRVLRWRLRYGIFQYSLFDVRAAYGMHVIISRNFEQRSTRQSFPVGWTSSTVARELGALQNSLQGQTILQQRRCQTSVSRSSLEATVRLPCLFSACIFCVPFDSRET